MQLPQKCSLSGRPEPETPRKVRDGAPGAGGYDQLPVDPTLPIQLTNSRHINKYAFDISHPINGRSQIKSDDRM